MGRRSTAPRPPMASLPSIPCLAAALGSPCRQGKTKANHLSRSACLIGRLRQIKPSLSLSTQSATVLHTTSSKREASRAPLFSGPFTARPVICAYAPAHSRPVLSSLPLTAHATIRTAPSMHPNLSDFPR